MKGTITVTAAAQAAPAPAAAQQAALPATSAPALVVAPREMPSRMPETGNGGSAERFGSAFTLVALILLATAGLTL